MTVTILRAKLIELFAEQRRLTTEMRELDKMNIDEEKAEKEKAREKEADEFRQVVSTMNAQERREFFNFYSDWDTRYGGMD